MSLETWYGIPMNRRQAVAACKRAGIDKARISRLENTDNYMITHGPDQCLGERCTVHNRSKHVMRKFPQYFRWDRGIMERTCPHGVGHPDPDSPWESGSYEWVHGCDGCCDTNSAIFKINEEDRKTRV